MKRARQHGLSLVELLVGCTAALLVALAATVVVSAQLRESTKLQLGMRLDHDLRTAFALVTRDLRRVGYWGAAASGIAAPGQPALIGPYGPATASTAASDTVRFSYSRDGSENNVLDDAEQFGFRLRGGALQLQLGNGNWQGMTDAAIVVTAFTVTPRVEEAVLAAYCELPCPAAAVDCPPRQQVRRFDVVLDARSALDARQQRSLRGVVRIRNDAVVGSCAT